jgi:uncharacterized protein YkwD
MNPVNSLVWEDGLALSARDHCADMGDDGATGSTGLDGSDFYTRIKRFGETGGFLGENIAYG